MVCFEAAGGAFFVVAGSESKGPSLSFVVVLVTFLVAVFFTGAGGSLGFIAAVLVVRVAVAGAGAGAGVVVFERVALVVIVAVALAGFGKREAILCTWFGCLTDACQSRRDAFRVTPRSRSVCSRRAYRRLSARD